ncbi:hypothetical protein ACPCK9_25610 [Streptomyces koyangensis]|uniref:hypothetical protein n=1 Tax=Streptomyces koyangensis TaxID=188770 RepID=UPI003700E9D6
MSAPSAAPARKTVKKAAKKVAKDARKITGKKKPDWILGPTPEDILSPATFRPEPKTPEAPSICDTTRLKHVIANPALYEVAATVFPPKTRKGPGRPAHYPAYIYLIYLAAISIYDSSRHTQSTFYEPDNWKIIRTEIRRFLGDEEADALPENGPSLYQWNDFYRKKFRPSVHEFRKASRDAWIRQAIAHGLLSEGRRRGDRLRPHRSQTINGDGTVVRPPSDQTEEFTDDEKTGERRRHRVDHDAGIQMEGGDRAVYGKKIVSFSVRQEARCHSRFILNVDSARHRPPEEDPERDEEASVALRLTHEILDRAPGVIAASFDTAWRGKHRAPLIRRGLIVFTRQHDGIKPHPLAKYKCKCKNECECQYEKCTHDVYAAAGRSCERQITVEGKTMYNPLPVREFIAREGKTGWRFYHRVEIPCRNGSHTELIPVYETQEDSAIDPRTKRKRFNRTEHLRQIPPGTHHGDRLLGFREDSESSNSSLDYSHRDKRVPMYGAEGALLGYLGYAWVNNSVALSTASNP